MPPPILTTSPTLSLKPEPFTRESFLPFGTAIIPPLPRTATSAPHPLSTHPKHALVPEPVSANQLSALKYSPISPLQDYYATWHAPSKKASEARMSMFSCFPRELRSVDAGGGSGGGKGRNKKVFDVNILERHPYTTQTFSPLGLSGDDDDKETYYLVIVAPSLKGETGDARTDSGETISIADPPDLKSLKAFIASGGQAVTYGAGTWHAPMVVVGTRRVDFIVTQFVNGVAEEDVQEARFPEGVVVDLGAGAGGQGDKAKL